MKAHMLKHYAILTAVEVILFSTALAVFCSYRAADSGELTDVSSAVLYGVAIVASNAAIYFLSRKTPWENLRSPQKVVRVIAAIMITFVVFLAELLCVHPETPMTPMAIFGTAALAAFSFSYWAIILVEIARDGGPRLFEKYTVRQRSYPAMCEGPLQEAVDGFEKEADEAHVRQPRAMRRVLVSVQCGDGERTLPEAIAALQKAVAKARNSGWRAALDAARWVDDFFADALVEDIRWHAGDWKAGESAIAELLDDVGCLLDEGTSRDSADPYPLIVEGFEKLGEMAVRQRIQAYSCIAASFSGDGAAFLSRLEVALSNVERNIRFIASQQNALDLAQLESGVSWAQYRPHDRYWTAPLNIIARCASAMGREREVIEAYERYVEFLMELDDAEGVFGHTRMDAKTTLTYLREASE